MLITFLWGLVLIVPGIVSALNYSMASFVLAEDDTLTSLEAMIKSKKLVYGFRGQIFIIYLCYFLVTLIAFIFFAALGFAMKQVMDMPFWLPIVIMLLGFLFVFIIFIIPYFELGLANVYLIIKEKKGEGTKPKRTRKTVTKKTKEAKLTENI